ncbi:MAG: hypothetical protein LUB59_07905 [Candidatus Gastranaerophilales bacterium]|nr:hypothetical protein [Candidatus Gastranaerophilales bacterium]
MKKLVYGIVMGIMMLLPVPANAGWDVQNTAQLQERMNSVGFNILNSNRIEHRMIFRVINRVYTRDIWADVSSVNRTVWIKPCILPYIDSDDELAGILSHQIAHGVDTYEGILRGYASVLNYWVSPNKYDLKADKRAVDYMVNAGYNPLALIVILNKIGQQYRYDAFSNHALISRRMMMIYEYIYTKYPSILADNDYKDNVYYQNFLLTSRKNRFLLQEHIKNRGNTKKKIKYL